MADSMRRQPKQARSQQRVNQILETAARLFEANGVENVTTNMIAAEAGISIGSLYQFFPNKDAIIEGLVAGFLKTIQESIIVSDGNESITTVISNLVDRLELFKVSQLGFRALFIETDEAENIHQAIITLTERVLGIHFPQLDMEWRHTTAVVGVAMVKGMLKLSNSPDNLAENIDTSEVKLALLAYLRATLRRIGVPLPPDLHHL